MAVKKKKRVLPVPQTGHLKGWKHTMSATARRKILDRMVKAQGYATTVGRLTLLRNYTKRTSPSTYKAATADWEYLKKKYRSGTPKKKTKGLEFRWTNLGADNLVEGRSVRVNKPKKRRVAANPKKKAVKRNTHSSWRKYAARLDKQAEAMDKALGKGGFTRKDLDRASKIHDKARAILKEMGADTGSDVREYLRYARLRWKRTEKRLKRLYSQFDKFEKMALAFAKKTGQALPNPLLMTVTANPLDSRHGNPQIEFRRRMRRMGKPVRVNPGNPFGTKKSISFRKFVDWAEKSLEPKLLQRLNKEVAAYKRSHGMLPKTVHREMIDFGPKDVVVQDVVYSLGVSPTETYIPPGGSDKGDVTYLHEYGDGDEAKMPHVVANSEGKWTIKPFKGKTVTKKWIEH